MCLEFDLRVTTDKVKDVVGFCKDKMTKLVPESGPLVVPDGDT